MFPKLSLECGPKNDMRVLNFQLPYLQRNIGVLVSGGLDSTLLYYLAKKLQTEKYIITPYTLIRNDGSQIHAQHVINHTHEILNIPNKITTFVEVNEQNSNLQVSTGISNIIKNYKVNHLLVGLIDTRPEHSIGFDIIYPKDSFFVSYPFKNLQKCHIIDLYYKLNIQSLIKYTHSCVYNGMRCGICNRCNERYWAFEKMNKIDEGLT